MNIARNLSEKKLPLTTMARGDRGYIHLTTQRWRTENRRAHAKKSKIFSEKKTITFARAALSTGTRYTGAKVIANNNLLRHRRRREIFKRLHPCQCHILITHDVEEKIRIYKVLWRIKYKCGTEFSRNIESIYQVWLLSRNLRITQNKKTYRFCLTLTAENELVALGDNDFQKTSKQMCDHARASHYCLITIHLRARARARRRPVAVSPAN